MKKLIKSLVCCSVLSMSLVGVGFASTATDTTGLGNNRQGNGMGTMGTDTRMTNQDTMNGTGTMNRTNGMTTRGRNGDNNTVSPLANNNNRNGNYRATAANDNDNDGFDWGWLGLAGLLGLAGMRSRTGERR